MGRETPTGLSDVHERALSEFFAGHITAGQLSKRLSLAGRPVGRPATAKSRTDPRPDPPAVVRRRTKPRLAWLIALLAIGAGAGGFGAALGSRSTAAGLHQSRHRQATASLHRFHPRGRTRRDNMRQSAAVSVAPVPDAGAPAQRAPVRHVRSQVATGTNRRGSWGQRRIGGSRTRSSNARVPANPGTTASPNTPVTGTGQTGATSGTSSSAPATATTAPPTAAAGPNAAYLGPTHPDSRGQHRDGRGRD
jgi:hypothetical protein